MGRLTLAVDRRRVTSSIPMPRAASARGRAGRAPRTSEPKTFTWATPSTVESRWAPGGLGVLVELVQRQRSEVSAR